MRVEVVEHLPGELPGERAPGERAEGNNANQRSLQRADVVLDAPGDDPQRGVVCEVDVVVVGALSQNR